MPTRPAKNCRRNGCPNRTDRGYCDICRRRRARVLDEGRPSSTERGYGAPHRQRREAALFRDPYCKCRGCPGCSLHAGCWRPSTEADHVTPKHLGGPDDLDNYQGLCGQCHRSKSAGEASALLLRAG